MKADSKKLAYVGAKPAKKDKDNRDSDSWFTPQSELDKVHGVLGQIDVDPFSCRQANKVVRAKKIFTQKNSSLNKNWFPKGKTGSVFMNPPYSRGLISPAVMKFLEQWDKDKIAEAIVLTNNATETNWFQSLLLQATAICHVKGRISFYNNDGKAVSNNTRGQVYFYFGEDFDSFHEAFKASGSIALLVQWG